MFGGLLYPARRPSDPDCAACVCVCVHYGFLATPPFSIASRRLSRAASFSLHAVLLTFNKLLRLLVEALAVDNTVQKAAMVKTWVWPVDHNLKHAFLRALLSGTPSSRGYHAHARHHVLRILILRGITTKLCKSCHKTSARIVKLASGGRTSRGRCILRFN